MYFSFVNREEDARHSYHHAGRVLVIAQTQLKLKSLRSNRRAQANRQQFDRKNETGK